MDTRGAGLAVGGVGVAANTAVRDERQREAGKGEDAGPGGSRKGGVRFPGQPLEAGIKTLGGGGLRVGGP